MFFIVFVCFCFFCFVNLPPIHQCQCFPLQKTASHTNYHCHVFRHTRCDVMFGLFVVTGMSKVGRQCLCFFGKDTCIRHLTLIFIILYFEINFKIPFNKRKRYFLFSFQEVFPLYTCATTKATIRTGSRAFDHYILKRLQFDPQEFS